MDHHRWWMSAWKLQPTEFGVIEHENVLRSVQFSMEYDQLDITNLVSFEVILRRCQLIEYHHEKKYRSAREKDDKNTGITREEAMYFTGTHKLSGELMVCPELLKYVATEVQQDVDEQKQARKACEEARLARGPK